MSKTKVFYLMLRGTGEPLAHTGNMLRPYNEMAEGVNVVDVPYPASIAMVNEKGDLHGDSLVRSVYKGAQLTAQYIHNLRTYEPGCKIIVAGYSLGAVAARHLAISPGLSQPDLYITVADPTSDPAKDDILWNQPPPRGYRGIATDGTIADAKPLAKYRVINHTNDPIACLHPASPLRNLVPFVWAMRFTPDQRKAEREWREQFARRLFNFKVTSFMNFLKPGFATAVAEAGPAIDRYLGTGHTGDYARRNTRGEGTFPCGNQKYTVQEIISLWIDAEQNA